MLKLPSLKLFCCKIFFDIVGINDHRSKLEEIYGLSSLPNTFLRIERIARRFDIDDCGNDEYWDKKSGNHK